MCDEQIWPQTGAKVYKGAGPGRPKWKSRPKGSTRKFEAVGDGLKFSGQNLNADGTTLTVEWTAYFDGKEYPIKGAPNADTLSLKRIDRLNTEGTFKKAGNVTYRVKRVVSQDGKAWTLTAGDTNTQGKPYSDVLVFDKQ